ncbi:MAG: glycoside hydrolase family 1 protein [Candidatus Sericytochromatia bacterium]
MKKIFNFILSLFLVLSFQSKSFSEEFNQKDFKFPEGFLWGTATSAYQVEGGIVNDWSKGGLDAGKASNHAELYEEDFEKAKKLGNNAYRMSIEWAKIEPEPDKFSKEAVTFYKNIFKSLKKHGLKPMVTIHHFTNPIWLEQFGGWDNEKVITRFTKYVTFLAKTFGEDVDLWLTFNEPNVYAFKAYATGDWPPFKKDRQSTLYVMNNLLKAHAEAYHILHKYDREDADGDNISCQVGFAQHIAILEPYWALNPLDNIMTYFQSKVFNQGFWDAVLTGKFDLFVPGLKNVNAPFNKKLKGSMDFVGFNYYTRWFIKANGENVINEKGELTDMKWEIYPEGLKKSIEMADIYAKELKIPIYITECGINDPSDKKRPKYIVTHVNKTLEAIKNGANVKGFMYWSLMDNFELADGFGPQFGLFTIDRKMRYSAEVYKEIADSNAITKNLYDKYLK